MELKDLVATEIWAVALKTEVAKILKYGNFGAIIDHMADLEGIPRTNTAGLNTEKYLYTNVWSLSKLTDSDSLKSYILDMLGELVSNYSAESDLELLIHESVENNLPIWTSDIMKIGLEDQSIATSEPEPHFVQSSDVNTAENCIIGMLREISYEAVDSWLIVAEEAGLIVRE